MSFQSDLAELFRRDLARLLREAEAFPGDAYLWQTAPGVKNAAGNLMLHLEGNLRHYIGHQLGGVPYQRDREFEFGTKGLPASGMIARIHSLNWIPEVIEKLTDEQLDATFPEPMWGAPRITRLFLLHLYGHLNLHLGQIGYLRRVLTSGEAIVPVQL